MKMENRKEENLPVNEDRSMEAFKQNELNGIDLGDSFSTISPARLMCVQSMMTTNLKAFSIKLCGTNLVLR